MHVRIAFFKTIKNEDISEVQNLRFKVSGKVISFASSFSQKKPFVKDLADALSLTKILCD